MAKGKRKAATEKKVTTTVDRRRRSSSNDSGDGGGGVPSEEEPKSKVAKTTTTESEATPGDTASITSLAQQIISAFQSNNYRLLHDCDNAGTIERKLWPWLLHCAAMTTTTTADSSLTLAEEEIALALVILSNRRGGGGGGSSSGETASSSGVGGVGSSSESQLFFVVDDYDYSKNDDADAATGFQSSVGSITPQQRTLSFAILLKLLLKYLQLHPITTDSENNTDDDDVHVISIAIQMEVIKFFIAAYSSMELRCRATTTAYSEQLREGIITTTTVQQQQQQGVIEGPLTDLVGVRLWDAIFSRKRHLELKRDGLLRKRYGLFEVKKKRISRDGEGDKDNTTNVGFLPGMVDGLLDAIVTLGNSRDGDFSGEDDDETGSSKWKRRHQLLLPLLRGYSSKILELLLDLMSYPQTRTHVASYLSSRNLVVLLRSSKLYNTQKKGKAGERFVLIRQQVDMLLESERMEVANTTSSPSDASSPSPWGGNNNKDSISSSEQIIHLRAHVLQKLLHRHHETETSEVIFAGVGRVCDSNWLRSKIDLWSENTLYDICYRLRLVDDEDGEKTEIVAKRLGCTRRKLLTSIFLYHHSSRPSDATVLSSAPLYPTESLLWDACSVPSSNIYHSQGGNESLCLPKLNTRFLSPGDYLLRNFRLFFLESAYDIRGDIVDVVKRMRPALKQDGYVHDDGIDYYEGNPSRFDEDDDASSKTEFHGWARMGLELGSKKRDKPGLRLLRVDPPHLGERVPSQVIAELVLDLHHCASSLVKEWDEVGEFDILFLVCVDATHMSGEAAPLSGILGRDGDERRVPDEEDCSFPRRYGVRAVRGCMVLEVRDEAGVILSDQSLAYNTGGRPEPKGKLRYLRVALDPAQYAADATGYGSRLGTDVYDTLNLVVRRSGRENNFKAVLETMRGLMKGGANSMYRSIPSWLMPVLLGYGGDPSMASFRSPKMKAFASKTTGVTSPDAALDYGDTFLDESHLAESFAGCDLTIDGMSMRGGAVTTAKSSHRKKYKVMVVENMIQNTTKVMATSYPFPPSYAGNDIRFTPVQVNAIRSGLSPGLTTIIGPPGTGKTDVAVQIIANLYHSFPTQRTVIVTHSNAALNDIFDKVMLRGDVDERHMLRLGSGERSLTSTSTSLHDFTKTGRVAHILCRRGELLEKVQQLSESLGVSGNSERGADGAPSYTCETSEYFYCHHVKKRIDLFQAEVAGKDDQISENVMDIFPFKGYSPMSDDAAANFTIGDAQGKIAEVKAIFDELAEYRPIELLRSQRQRTDYLLTNQAKIVAMTCTHAAIARSHLVKLGFLYDNILMEEAGQMLDVETFIPLLLQRGESDDASSDSISTAHSRLKRVCLIGDHNQLPPVVKNQSFSRYSHYDQSMFARLVRLGVPSIELDKQGRARQDIAKLYSWRYDNLGNLDHVTERDVFKRANAGLANTFQLINVEDFEVRID